MWYEALAMFAVLCVCVSDTALLLATTCKCECRLLCFLSAVRGCKVKPGSPRFPRFNSEPSGDERLYRLQETFIPFLSSAVWMKAGPTAPCRRGRSRLATPAAPLLGSKLRGRVYGRDFTLIDSWIVVWGLEANPPEMETQSVVFFLRHGSVYQFTK